MSISTPAQVSALEVLDKVANRTKHSIFINVLINYVGKIDLVLQTFIVRFDVYVEWETTGKFKLPSIESFKPVLQFPEAESWDRDLDDIEFNLENVSGYRASITGTFRSSLDFRNFRLICRD